ncbi:MAG: hypothetical protein K9K79_10620, partial [Desulfohalobiaceae bacterium]|nr:hypothetical protein [Desulfohalobiaceae bacterium]
TDNENIFFAAGIRPSSKRSHRFMAIHLQTNRLFAMPHGEGICLPASYCWQAKRESIRVNPCDPWAIICLSSFSKYQRKTTGKIVY